MRVNSTQDNFTAKRHLSLVLSHTEPHMSIYFLPVYKTASTLRLFIKTLFKFSCIHNILPDNISQYLFLTFLINDTSYYLYHKWLPLTVFSSCFLYTFLLFMFCLLKKIITSWWKEHVKNSFCTSHSALAVQIYKIQVAVVFNCKFIVFFLCTEVAMYLVAFRNEENVVI